ncbi:ORF6N domain-containing protein [Sulfurimonas sp. RIFOXYB12_FULL_35_9]|uniref:ORF6N domain-containing protein n=1 Tax=Sulfurimonas sp. RIFOXYB12_FULL_35_9 TaxID=1802256 RepID=UPI0008C34194|nr:ORF6N domain-containing protein [Sulfurimonas sp. RIFOXYB12_FULL_35_9]OHE05923.1 MAG: DNA-binding protein [Sulfurimonas sp. RIFOXYB12_FULL_35_9]
MQIILEEISSKIYTIRGVQVMLDRDLARLYKVENRVLNQAVKRNIERFPLEFMFQLTKEEFENWKSQIVISNSDKMGLRKIPYVFTEQGVSMLSAVLKSDTAIQTSIKIINSFVQMRKFLLDNASIFQRFDKIEQQLLLYDNNFNKIFKAIESKQLKPTQGIFYDRQIYDAYIFASDLIKTAKEEIILIDNYLDDTVLTLFSKVPNIQVTIYTNNISKQLKLDYEKYTKQYGNITLKTFKNSHDRFMILDKKKIFHLGASLKDLGKKWFAFSKINIDVDDLLSKLN